MTVNSEWNETEYEVYPYMLFGVAIGALATLAATLVLRR